MGLVIGLVHSSNSFAAAAIHNTDRLLKLRAALKDGLFAGPEQNLSSCKSRQLVKAVVLYKRITKFITIGELKMTQLSSSSNRICHRHRFEQQPSERVDKLDGSAPQTRLDLGLALACCICCRLTCCGTVARPPALHLSRFALNVSEYFRIGWRRRPLSCCRPQVQASAVLLLLLRRELC